MSLTRPKRQKGPDQLKFRVHNSKAEGWIKDSFHGVSPFELGKLTDERAHQINATIQEVDWQYKLAKELEKKLGPMFEKTANIEEIRAALGKVALDAKAKGDKALSDLAVAVAGHDAHLRVLKNDEKNRIGVLDKGGDYAIAQSNARFSADLQVMEYRHGKAIANINAGAQSRMGGIDAAEAQRIDLQNRMDYIRNKDYVAGAPGGSSNNRVRMERRKPKISAGSSGGRGVGNFLGGLFR